MDCVPCPCDLFDITDSINCGNLVGLMSTPPRLGQLYSGLYTATTYAPEILAGVPEILEDNFRSIALGLAFAFIIPWVIIFIVLFIVLGCRGIITFGTAFTLTLLVIIVVFIALAFIYFETLDHFRNIRPLITDRVRSNWDNNKTRISQAVSDNYVSCNYCDSFNPNCTANCGGVCACACTGDCPPPPLNNTEDILLSIINKDSLNNNISTEQILNTLRTVGGNRCLNNKH